MQDNFRTYMLISVCVHMALLLVLWVGLPSFSRDYTPPKKMIDVALISEQDLKKLGQKSQTKLKNKKQVPAKKVTPKKDIKPKPVKKPEPKPVVKPAPKKPEPKPVVKPTPKPTPKPKAEKLPQFKKITPEKEKPVKEAEKLPDFKEKQTPPKPEPQKPEPQKPEPQEKPKTEQKPEPKKPEPKIQPKDKQDEQEQVAKKEDKKPNLDSALKNLESLQSQAITNNKNRRIRAGVSNEDKGKIQKAKQTRLADKASRSGTTNGELSADEMDALREQIADSWSVPIGVRGIEDMEVEILVKVNPDKTVSSAQLLDNFTLSKGERTFAESALRAVLQIDKLDLPDGKFKEWQTIRFVFNAREMLGY